jgi:hypothetical protein
LLLGGIVVPFVALSCSHYKLPHYIFVIFPLVAIVTARLLIDLVEIARHGKTYAFFYRAQSTIDILLWIFTLVCMTLFFPCSNVFVWLSVVLLMCMAGYFMRKKNSAFIRLTLPSIFSIFALNLMLNLHFFPCLLSFQGGSRAGEYVHENNIPTDRFFTYKINSSSTDFYSRSIVQRLDSASIESVLQRGRAWIYTERAGIRRMEALGYHPVVVDSFSNMHVTMVTSKFLFFKTRPASMGEQYIVSVGQ